MTKRQLELMNEYQQLSKEWHEAINAALKVAGTDKFYPALEKAEVISHRFGLLWTIMAIKG